jgi:hypothetical protein
MLLIVRYQNGMRVNAILLTASHDLIRVVIPNCTDTVEFPAQKKTLDLRRGLRRGNRSRGLGWGTE